MTPDERRIELSRVGPTIPCDPSRPHEFVRELRGMGVPRLSYGQVTLPQPQPSTWYRLNDGEAPYCVCPECGHPGRLGSHDIDAQGLVTPSVVCPISKCGDGVVRCTAHYYARLLDWGVRG